MRTIFTTFDSPAVKDTVITITETIVQKWGFAHDILEECDANLINDIIEKKDGALLIVGISNNKSIQKYLNRFRQIRIPYIFVKEGQNFNIKEIILPITNLLEEKEKGPFASSIARFFHTKIKIYQPNDYGTRAINNIDSITNLFDSFSLEYFKVKGTKDSNGIELEAVEKETDDENKLAIVTASREYGLDDIIFGPKERKIIKKSNMPIMLINPRGDLYALCE